MYASSPLNPEGILLCHIYMYMIFILYGTHHGRDRIVVVFTTNVMCSNHTHGDMCSIHYLLKFVSDLRQVGSFLQILRFPPPMKLTATI